MDYIPLLGNQLIYFEIIFGITIRTVEKKNQIKLENLLNVICFTVRSVIPIIPHHSFISHMI